MNWNIYATTEGLSNFKPVIVWGHDRYVMPEEFTSEDEAFDVAHKTLTDIMGYATNYIKSQRFEKQEPRT